MKGMLYADDYLYNTVTYNDLILHAIVSSRWCLVVERRQTKLLWLKVE